MGLWVQLDGYGAAPSTKWDRDTHTFGTSRYCLRIAYCKLMARQGKRGGSKEPRLGVYVADMEAWMLDAYEHGNGKEEELDVGVPLERVDSRGEGSSTSMFAAPTAASGSGKRKAEECDLAVSNPRPGTSKKSRAESAASKNEVIDLTEEF